MFIIYLHSLYTLVRFVYLHYPAWSLRLSSSCDILPYHRVDVLRCPEAKLRRPDDISELRHLLQWPAERVVLGRCVQHMLDSILRWLVAVAMWVLYQSQGMQLERTMAGEELRDVMGGPDPLALQSIPNVREELVRMPAYSCSFPSCLPFWSKWASSIFFAIILPSGSSYMSAPRRYSPRMVGWLPFILYKLMRRSRYRSMGRTPATTGRHAVHDVAYALVALIRTCLWAASSFFLCLWMILLAQPWAAYAQTCW